MSKVSSPPILNRESMPDAPEGEWFERLLDYGNGFNDQVARALRNGVTLADNTPYKTQSYILKHGVETEIVPPLARGLSCRGVSVLQCEGIEVDATTQKPTGKIYSLGLSGQLQWRPSGKPSGTIYVTANYGGTVGEIQQASVLRGAGIALTTTVDVVVSSVSLGAGTWLITARAGYAGLTTATFAEMSISTTSSHTGVFGISDIFGPANSGGGDAFLEISNLPVTLTSTTTYNMVCDATFTVSSSPRAYGIIVATRTAIDSSTTGRVNLLFYGE